jgi:hypothetical protein
MDLHQNGKHEEDGLAVDLRITLRKRALTWVHYLVGLLTTLGFGAFMVVSKL